MRRPASLLLGLSAAAALHPQLRLAARRPLAAAVRMSSQEDLSKRTVVQLKAYCKDRGLSVDGRKGELVERLKGALASEPEDEDEDEELCELDAEGLSKCTVVQLKALRLIAAMITAMIIGMPVLVLMISLMATILICINFC